MNLDIMEVDAAQYASISLEMMKSNQWLQVFDRHEDYLDKPPLLFWLSAFSFKLFGVGSWQYKLPSVIFSLIGLLSTFKLGERLYNKQIGHYAALILGGSLAMIMINNDIKTDTILVASIVFSIWMYVSAIETNIWKYFIGAALGTAAAMLTKGPIGLMMPLLAIGGHLILKRNLKPIWNLKWLLVIFLVAVMLVPMCIGLYRQHGWHGLEFYFWLQSFGRITGENEWHNDTTVFYFIHVFLWSFLPWTVLAIAGVFNELGSIRKKLQLEYAELYLISGIVLVWLGLSLSKFKLPHYIFVVYPLIAILTAKLIHQTKHVRRWARFQFILTTVVLVALIAILRIAFPEGGWLVPAAVALLLSGAFFTFLKTSGVKRVFFPTFIGSVAIGFGLNLHFYPALLPYQANAVVGKWAAKEGINDGRLIGFATGGRALDFYAGGIVPWMDNAEEAIAAIDTGIVVYASQKHRDDLIERGYEPKSEMVFDDFRVQRLTVEFLNPKTRQEAVEKNYLMLY